MTPPIEKRLDAMESNPATGSAAGLAVAAAVMLIVTLALPAVPLWLAACQACL